MPYVPSDTAKRLVALLSNARILAVHRQMRSSAVGVVKACKELSTKNKFNLPEHTFDVLIEAIPEKQSSALSAIFSATEDMVVKTDMVSKGEEIDPLPSSGQQKDRFGDVFSYLG